MKSLTTVLSLVGLLAATACTQPAPGTFTRPTDTGNMAFPTPAPAGNIGTARPAALDTGSMNVPSATGGTLAPAPATNDTGNMALPRRAQGNSRPVGQ